MSSAEDKWAAWLRRRRSGGDTEFEARTVEQLKAARERILDNAAFEAGETLLDVGCGNGLVAFGALERGAGRVVFTDVSEPLLAESRSLAADLSVLELCEFVQASADDLASVLDESVDVVTTRSVLIYVDDKARAFAEFFRVLRPEGRISLFEPINCFGMEIRRQEFFTFDDPALGSIGAKLDALFAELQPPDKDPMLDFDERDLMALAESAGFFPVRTDVRLVVEPSEPRSWKGFLSSAGNPKLPTFAEAMDQVLSAEETERLVEYLRPRVEQGLGRWRMGSAYLWATKPG
jgi:ubiquinone/menaquinone biosynthesis C-methylase UbiE